jgi:hypothetical protein
MTCGRSGEKKKKKNSLGVSSHHTDSFRTKHYKRTEVVCAAVVAVAAVA